MKKYKSNLFGFARNLATAKFLNRNKKHQSESAVSFSESNEQDIKNWGKTAEYLPEVGGNHLATSLFQLELERARASAVA
jgi:hypothetical protein